MAFYPAISPYIKGIIIAGSILPTLNFLPKERLTPTQNMSIEPMNEMFAIMLSVHYGGDKACAYGYDALENCNGNG